MKKVILLLMVLFTGLSFMACKNPAGTDPDTPGSLESEWWIKGSFDGWQGDPKHFFTMDELDNNILRYEITDIWSLDYQFVLVNPAGEELKSDGAITLAADGTEEAITWLKGDTATNPVFTAGYTSYTVEINITDPDAPTLKVIPGSTASTAPTFAVLAENLLIKGSLFTIGWTNTAGVAFDNDDGTGTVTFDLLPAGKTGEFGFESMDGWLANATIDVPTAATGSSSAFYLTSGSNATFDAEVPFSDSAYSVVVTIDSNAAIDAKYEIVVTLTTLGGIDWAYEPWAEVYIPGTFDGGTNWPGDRAAIETPVDSDHWEYTFTATNDPISFKIGPNDDWSQSRGLGDILVGAANTQTLTDNGNIDCTVTVGESYTITIDFIGTFTTDGVPTVAVIHNP